MNEIIFVTFTATCSKCGRETPLRGLRHFGEPTMTNRACESCYAEYIADWKAKREERMAQGDE